MTVSRRQFLRGFVDMVGAATAAELGLFAWSSPAIGDEQMGRMAMPQLAAPKVPLVNPVTLARFVDPLPIPPVARAMEQREHPAYPGRRLPFYRMEMRALRGSCIAIYRPRRYGVTAACFRDRRWNHGATSRCWSNG